MKTVILEAKKDTPKVHLDIDKNLFKISGASYPENAFSIYSPVLEWIRQMMSENTQPLECEFYYNYINSSSKKRVYEVLIELEKWNEKAKNITIVWLYDKFDEDMFELGEEFSELVHLPFKFKIRDITD